MIDNKILLRLLCFLAVSCAGGVVSAQGLPSGSLDISEEAIEAPAVELIAQGQSFSSVAVRQCVTCPPRIFKTSDNLEVKLGDRLLTKPSDFGGEPRPGVVFFNPRTEVVGRITFFE